MNRIAGGCLLALILATFGCNNTEESNDNYVKTTPVINFNLVRSYPHDTGSFTQGLTFYQNILFEGTGLEGKSRLMQVDLNTGKALKEVALEKQYFGEGVAVLHDTLYQLTWQNKVVFLYNAKDLAKIGERAINMEGWGVTTDGNHLIVSNGSNNLYFYEPGTFKLLRVQSVTENGTPAVNLNELEYINGFVYANQWQYPYILKIDPATGEVVAKMDFSDLVNQVKASEPQAMEFNGIAYNPDTKKVYVTGKNWSQIYEIGFEF